MVGATGSNQTAKGSSRLEFDASLGALSSTYFVKSVETGISAAGTAQANAKILGNSINVVTTIINGANSVRLPNIDPGMTIFITNGSANVLNVYPPANAAINSAAANAVYTQNPGATLFYIAPTVTQWYTVGATYA
jgi:hypothetical protein